MTRFVIFGFPRCGSTYLCSLLESHPKVLCHYEVFHPEEIVTLYNFHEYVEEINTFTPQLRDQNPAEFIDFLYRNSVWGDAVGFKIFIGHSEKAHDLILGDNGIKKILLRRSPIPAYASMLIAEKTGAFTHQAQSDDKQVKVSLDVAGLLNFYRLINEYFEMLKRRLTETGQDFLEIEYEQLVSDPAVIDSVFSFIGVETGRNDIRAFTRKQNKQSLADKIDNVDEVVAEAVDYFYQSSKLVTLRDAEIAMLRARLSDRDSQLAEYEQNIKKLTHLTEDGGAAVAESGRLEEGEVGE